MKSKNAIKKLVAVMLSLFIMLPYINPQNTINILFAHAEEMEEGYYFIKHLDSGRYVDVTDMSTSNGTQLQLWDKYQYHANQVFKFERVDGEYWKITSLYNGKAMEVQNSGTDDNDHVQQWDYGNIACQQWEIIPLGAGIALKNRNSGKLLNTYQAKSSNGTKLVQYKENNKAAQIFALEPIAVGSNGALEQRTQNETDCYNYLKNQGLNCAAVSGILASMYAENKFVFGVDALDFYYSALCSDNSNTFNALLTTPNTEAGATSAAYAFNHGKLIKYYWSLYQDDSNPYLAANNATENVMIIARDRFWPRYSRIDRILNMPAFQQDDDEWGDIPYSANLIRYCGCGIISYMNAVYALTGVKLSANELANYAKNNNCYTTDNYQFFYNAPFGDVVFTGDVFDWESLRNKLNEGNVVIQNLRFKPSNSLEDDGHFIVITAYDAQTNKYRVLDCAAGYRSYGAYRGDFRPTSNEGSWLSESDFNQTNNMTCFIGDYHALAFAARDTGATSAYYNPSSGNGGNGNGQMAIGVYRLKWNMYFRTAPNMYSDAISVIPGETELEITELSNYSWGETVYNGREGWVNVNPSYATYLRPIDPIRKPNSPMPSLVSGTDIALNAISSVSWEAVEGADSYTITVCDEAGNVIVNQPGITATSTCFTLNEVGSYTVKAVAVNSKYTSDEAILAQKIVVHPNSTVIFMDGADGNVLSKQSVQYGSDAVLPETPTKKGFSFIGWNGSYTSITQDTTIVAKWQRNKYNVNFYNGTGSTLDSQRVLYEGAAQAPQAPTMDGYTFKGWDKKFDHIEGDLDVYPVFAWSNADLPVVISNVKAERDSAGYNVSYSLKSVPKQSTECRLVISLKTAEGKLITYTESNAYHLREESSITDTIYVPSQEVASIVEINAVRKFKLLIPIAANSSGKVTGSAFTNWSTEKPPADAQKVEQQKEYRYRTKTFKESNVPLSSPWVFEKKTTGYTEYGAAKRSDSPVAASDTRSVEVKTEQHHDFVGYKMVYYCTQEAWEPYNRCYRDFSIANNLSAYGARVSYGEWTNTTDPLWIKIVSKEQLASASVTPPGEWFYGTQKGINKSSKNGYNFANDSGIEKEVLWFVSEEVYKDYTTTYYLYRDRSIVDKYTYSQLSDYSAWSTTKPASADNKVIEERTVYRYIPANTITKENTEGKSRTISGTVDSSFAGKQALLFVYKIDEAADYTNEAVAQTVIGKNGEYSFTFKLREEPTSLRANGAKKPTGDFTVTLGIEGTSSVIYLDPIKAPVPEYTVNFVDYDGTVLLSAKVKEGESAPLPDVIPERIGYTFAGWNNDPSEIHYNVTMSALYIQNTYTVAFADWTNESISLQEYHYGDSIIPPVVQAPAGYEFKGWDILINENAFVTENMVATAIYEPRQLNVSFVDYNGEVISSQTVSYGNSVTLPEALDDLTDRHFVYWSIDESTAINNDMVVEPVVSYLETASTPVVSLESDSYDKEQTVTITTEDDSKIFYTLDGSNPAENGMEYREAFTISRSCVLKCIAKSPNKNNSEIVTRVYAINSDDSVTEFMAYDLLPEYVRNNAADYDVMSAKGYRYNMKAEVSSLAEYKNMIANGWETESETWSEWSDWAPSLTGTTDLTIEQNVKDPEPVDTVFYQYSHWVYFDEESGKYQYSANEIEGFDCKQEIIESPQKLTVYSFADGVSTYSLNGQMWFNQEIVTKSIIPNEKLYQYRYKIYTMSKLSDWVETLPENAEAVEEGEVFCYREPERYILTITDEIGTTIDKQLVLANISLALNMDKYSRAGYSIDGLISSDGTEWNIEDDVITENTTLIVKYSPLKYTVTFVDEDVVISKKTVNSFSYAAPPDMYNKEGLVFAGWDNDGYQCVSEDIIINAKFIPDEDAPSLTVAMNNYYLFLNSQTQLKVETKNIPSDEETIIWTSMNPGVVSVNDNGIATAHSAGVTDIIITEVSTGLVTVCRVTSLDGSEIENSTVSTDEVTTSITSSSMSTTVTTVAETTISSVSTNDITTSTDESTTSADITTTTVSVDATTSKTQELLTTVTSSVTTTDNNEISTISTTQTSALSSTSKNETTTAVTTTQPAKNLGDVNDDGKIDAKDASLILVAYSKASTGDDDGFTESQKYSADVNDDGKIDAKDASLILAYYALASTALDFVPPFESFVPRIDHKIM